MESKSGSRIIPREDPPRSIMRHFDLLILINRHMKEVYDHLADPGNLPDILPPGTSIKPGATKKDEGGAKVNQFEIVTQLRLFRIPYLTHHYKVACKLSRPPVEMDYSAEYAHRILVRSHYEFREEKKATQVKIRMEFVKVDRWMEEFVYSYALKAEREILINLKEKLEKRD